MKTTPWRIATYILIASLTGCAATSIQKDFAFKAGANEGIVVVSISHDLAGRRASKAIFYMDDGLPGGRNLLFSLGEAAPGITRGSEFKDSYGQLLVLSLPAGKHTIDSWQITNGTGLRIFPKEKPQPLVFEVVSGQVKYLGNLHANLASGKNIFGVTIIGNGYPEIRDQRQRDISIFEDRYPQFKNKIIIDLLQPGPWIQFPETRKQIDTVIMPVK